MTNCFVPALVHRHMQRLAVGLFAFTVAGCSSNSTGLDRSDGSVDMRADVAAKRDVPATGAGGAAGRIDGGGDARGPSADAGGALVVLDGGAVATGGKAGVAGAGGSGGSGNSGRATGGAIGSGGTAAAGAPGTGGGGGSGAGGTASGAGGAARDAATGVDGKLDVAADLGAVDAERPDLPPGRRDAALADGSQCGGLDEPCCDQQTCTAPGTVCTGGTGGGTCESCGGDGQLCCAGDVCTAPGTSCVSGGGRGSGTCR